uniref:Uncharacterized protein n=1 Tax=Octopus bimaculoides TaxID=37653 RepID=A0A0L8H5U7_OCTBM
MPLLHSFGTIYKSENNFFVFQKLMAEKNHAQKLKILKLPHMKEYTASTNYKLDEI